MLKFTYTVVDPEARELTVGRGCVKKLTGWTLEWKEARRLLWLAERTKIRDANWARFCVEHFDLAVRIEQEIAEHEERYAGRNDMPGGRGHEAKLNISEGPTYSWQKTGWEYEYAQQCVKAWDR